MVQSRTHKSHKSHKSRKTHKSRKGGDMANTLVDGAATFGRVTTIISTLFFTLIGFAMIGCGIYIVTMKREGFDGTAAATPPATPPVTEPSSTTTTTTTTTVSNNPPPKALGWGLIILGVFILIGTWVWLYFVWNYKGVAAVAGVAEGVNIIGDGIDNSF